MRAHHAAARGPRRRQQDVEVARQLRRASPRRRGSSSASSCRSPTSSCPATSPSPPAGTPTASTRSPARWPTDRCTPVDAKRLLARTVVDLYHGDGAGDAAQAGVRPGVPGPRRARRDRRLHDPRGRRAARRPYPGRPPARARLPRRGAVEQGGAAQDRAGRRAARRRGGRPIPTARSRPPRSTACAAAGQAQLGACSRLSVRNRRPRVVDGLRPVVNNPTVPASVARLVPLTYDASSLLRKIIGHACSEGVERRPDAPVKTSVMSPAPGMSTNWSIIGVCVAPGLMQLMRTFGPEVERCVLGPDDDRFLRGRIAAHVLVGVRLDPRLRLGERLGRRRAASTARCA